jgi:hypothetical protein
MVILKGENGHPDSSWKNVWGVILENFAESKIYPGSRLACPGMSISNCMNYQPGVGTNFLVWHNIILQENQPRISIIAEI